MFKGANTVIWKFGMRGSLRARHLYITYIQGVPHHIRSITAINSDLMD